MVTAQELGHTVAVTFPEVAWFRNDKRFGLEHVAALAVSRVVECVVLAESRTRAVRWARLSDGYEATEVCFSSRFDSRGAARELHAPNATVENGALNLGANAIWCSHPAIVSASLPGSNQTIRESWAGYPSLSSRGSDTGSVGLRPPQLGALHAIAAHWSVKQSAAKVVLPTGTGKTEVMIASAMLSNSLRTLVVVPSDALRTQISEKFARLGILRGLGAIGDDALFPIVGKLFRAPENIEQIAPLRSSNVIVSTTQMLLGMDDETLREFLGWFDLVVFDEAHHVPAASWTRIKDKAADRARMLLLTATPYRNDGRKVPGELIYQFPLRLAQAQGYFAQIAVQKIDEADPQSADQAIARAAVETLRTDELSGFAHTVLARARSKEHADQLLHVYEHVAPHLRPVVLHSSIGAGAKRSAIEGLRNGSMRIVICVDMLGEGFDLPSLKIAAMHDLHKSLPVTLQFIGRFTRSTAAVGSATAVINLASPMANTAVAELFSEDADWNDLVPELSARAIRSEHDVEEFVARMRAKFTSEDRVFDLALLAPKLSLSLIRGRSFYPERFGKALSRHSRLHQSWISDEGDVAVFITQDPTFPDWSLSKEAAGFEWNLCVLARDTDSGIIYVNSSSPLSLSKLARAVAGDDSIVLGGEQMFRIFDGLYRAILFNVGLYRRGNNVRFQMLAGIDIGEHVSQAIQSGSSKSNIFAQGFIDGKKVGVGASFKGRIWAMSNASIPDWLDWARRIAAKVNDGGIATDSILRYALIPTEVTELPDAAIFCCLPPDELIPGDYFGEKKISVAGSSTIFSQADVAFELVGFDRASVIIEMLIGSNEPVRLMLTWRSGFLAQQIGGPRAAVFESRDAVSIADYLTEHAPPLLLNDGSELVGKYHFRHPAPYPYVFSPESILPIDWRDTPIRQESKWRAGHMREASVQGYMIERLLAEENDYVFDDDDAGEAADIIVLKVNQGSNEIEATLYHCKFSDSSTPASRVGDLYEVCGQAVKSSRVLHRLEGLVAHMISRESRRGSRPTRFEKGTLSALRSLERRAHLFRLRLQVSIVQPGLSASALTADASAILAAADGFLLEFTGRRLRVFGSA